MNALLCLAALASGPPTTILREPDQLDHVLLADGRPILLRIHLRNNDKPYGAAIDDWTERMFRWFDRDRDGSLSGAEAARLIPADWITTFVQGGIRNDRPASIPFATLDKDRDGKVSLVEFRAYMQQFFPPLSVQMRSIRADRAARVNEAIWKRLDADRDGKLSEAELAKLPTLLATFDENEDEMLSESELLHESSDGYAFGFGPRSITGPAASFLVSLNSTTPGQVAATLLKKYGKGGKATRAEIGLSEAEFAALDLNRDGRLDSRELERFVLRTPDVTFRGRLGSAPGAAGLLGSIGIGLAPQRLSLLTTAGTGLARSVKRRTPDAVWLELDGTRIDLVAMSGAGFGRASGIAGFYLNQFSSTLTDKAKGLTREQADGNQYVAGLFTGADRNADGLLERKEFADFLELLGGGAGASVTLQVDDGGRGLFGVIDADGNGQLSIRELRSAWKRISPLCKGGKLMAREYTPRRVQVTFIDGPVYNQGFVNLPSSARPPLRSGSVPGWFSKMDRNGDGDISPAEWLGSEEEFKKLDLDGDGLISVDEARKSKADPTKR